MAPKRSEKQKIDGKGHVAVSKRLLEKTAPKKDDGGLVCIYKNQPPHPCNSCEQTQFCFEKAFLPKKRFVYWTKNHTGRDGIVRPQGGECGLCFSTRRRYYTEDAAELKSKRLQNPKLDAEFEAQRTDKALGTGNFNSVARGDTVRKIITTTTAMDEGFEAGHAYFLKDFRRLWGLQHITDDEDLIAHRAAPGKTGAMTVFVPQKPVGSAYEYKIGISDTVQATNEEQVFTEGALEEVFEEKCNELTPMQDDGAECPGCAAHDDGCAAHDEAGERGADSHSTLSARSRQRPGVAEQPAQAAVASPAVSEDSDDDAGTAVSAAASTRASSASARGGAVRTPSARGRGSGDLLETPAPVEEGNAAAQAAPRKRHLGAKLEKQLKERKKGITGEEVPEAGRELLKTVRAKLTASAQWSSRLRTRDQDSVLKQVKDMAAKVAGQVALSEASGLAETLYSEAMMFAERDALFTRWRTHPETALSEKPTDREIAVFDTCDTPLKVNILHAMAVDVLAKGRAYVVLVAGMIPSTKQTQWSPFNLKLNTSDEMFAKCQANLLSAIIDKLVGFSQSEFIETTEELAGLVKVPELWSSARKDVADGFTKAAWYDWAILCFGGECRHAARKATSRVPCVMRCNALVTSNRS